METPVPQTPNTQKWAQLGLEEISGGWIKASILQKLVEPVGLYQKGSFPLSLATGSLGYHGAC